MGMSRCYSLIKCLLILLSTVFLCVGVLSCAACGWALWDGRASETPAGRAGLCAILAWALALAIGALASLWGCVRGAGWLSGWGAALLALSCAASAGAACWGGAHLPELRRSLDAALRTSMQNDYGVLPARTQLLDVIQQELQCCGADSIRDWQSSVYSRRLVASAELSDAPAAALPALPAPHVQGALDLSVAAPAEHYYVPPSCCSSRDESECSVSRRVSWTSVEAGVWEAGCGARAAGWARRGAPVPLSVAAAMLLLHALTALLALALCVAKQPTPGYKA